MAEPGDYSTLSASPAWRVRSYRGGDEEAVTRLFAEVFGRPLSVEHYRWKVIDSPWPVGAPTAWLAEADGRAVGHYAGTPQRFKLGDTQHTIVHSCDAMTAPDLRRQGVLSAVGGAATAAWAGAGVPFLIGLPHAGWGTRRHYLGWREMFEATWLSCPLRPERLLTRRGHWPALLLRLAAGAGGVWNHAWDARLGRAGRGVTVRPVQHPGPAFDALWAAYGDRYEALVVRDCAWLTYRYAQAPQPGYQILLATRAGEPAGYLVYRLTADRGHRTGWLADLFTAPEDRPARAALLAAARQALGAAGAGAVRALVPRGTALERELRRAGFWHTPGSYQVSIVPLATGATHPALRDPNRWYTMAGDYDVV